MAKNNAILLLVAIGLLGFRTPASSQSIPSNASKKIFSDTTEANRILNQQSTWIEAGQVDLASLEKIKEAQDIYQAAGLWEKYIECFILSAKWYTEDGFELKAAFAEKAITAINERMPKAELLLAKAKYQLAEGLIGQDMPDSSFYYFRQIVPIFKIEKEWKELVFCELLMAVNYINAGQYDSCEVHVKEGLAIIQQYSLNDDLKTGFYNVKSILCYISGDYNLAIKLINQAIDIKWGLPQKTENDTLFILSFYTNLAAFFNIKGDFKRAEDCFLKIIGIYTELGYDVFEVDPDTYNNLGKLLIRQERYNQAVFYFNKNLSNHLLHKEVDAINRVDSYNELSNCYLKLGQLDSVVYYAKKTLAEPGFDKNYLAYFRLGQYQMAKGEIEEAIQLLEKSKLFYSPEIDITTDPNFPTKVHLYVGDAFFAQKKYKAALEFYQKALVLNNAEFKDSLDIYAQPTLKGVSDPYYFLETLQAKATALAALSDETENLETAYETYQLAIQWIDSMRVNYAEEGDRLFWGKKFKKIYGEAADAGRRLYEVNRQPRYLEDAFGMLEKSKSLLLLEALKASEGVALAGLPDSLVQKEKDLGIDLAFFEKSLRNAKRSQDSTQAAFYQSQLANTRLELAGLKETQEKNYPTYYALKYGGHATTISDLQQFLPDDRSAFLEYFLGDSTAFVFVATKSHVQIVPLPGTSSIEAAALRFQQQLTNPSAFRQNAKAAFSSYNQAAFDLYQAVVAPVLAVISDDIDNLIIIPDRVLHSIPFEALTLKIADEPSIDFAALPYLIRQYQIHYAYSAQLLLNNRERQKRLPTNQSCYALAPLYQGKEMKIRTGKLDQLQEKTEQLEGTALEIKAIAEWFPGEFDFGSTATEAIFKQKANQFGLLHLAMHGQADFENASFAHLKFSDLDNNGEEDNLLHHYEIANLALNAQLVVLSACETGLGKYEEGEGVFSLARSFMYAGVPSVVMSLWKVNDQSTSLLMPYFYENLSEGLAKKTALHQAKLTFLEEASLEFRHPYFWSGFVLLGDTQPVKGEGNYLWWVVAGVLLIGIIVWGVRNYGSGHFRKGAV